MKQTGVYVSGLPDDVTVDELAAHFSKAGIILEDTVQGGPRIKLYGSNDALVVYLREESVGLATQILDESRLRPHCVIRVEPARYDARYDEQATLEEDGPREDAPKIDKQTWNRKMDRMRSKLTWEEEGAAEVRAVEKRLRFERTAVLHNMFRREDLERDPEALLLLEEDLRSECLKLGAVKRVVVMEDRQCVAVRFEKRDSAVGCVQRMNNRWYDGRKISAELYDGSFKIRPAKKSADTPEDAF